MPGPKVLDGQTVIVMGGEDEVGLHVRGILQVEVANAVDAARIDDVS
jgi:hypothetical protein